MYTNQVITGVTGFDGDNTAVWSYRPQLDVASDWLTWLVGGRGQIAERQASVAYINIGGNDAGFSSAIKQCVLSWECHLPDEHLGTNEHEVLLGFAQQAAQDVPRLLADLDDNLTRRPWFDGQVVYSVAPDPLHFNGDVPCGETGEMWGPYPNDPGTKMQDFPEDELSPAELDFLWETIGVPLTESMRTQAADNGWSIVETDFTQHGICARAPWINNNTTAVNQQGADLAGTPDLSMGNWHPNQAGYRNWSTALVPQIIDAVREQLRADTTISRLEVHGGVVEFDYEIEPRSDVNYDAYSGRSMNYLGIEVYCMVEGAPVYSAVGASYVHRPQDGGSMETISIRPCDGDVDSVSVSQTNCFTDLQPMCGESTSAQTDNWPH